MASTLQLLFSIFCIQCGSRTKLQRQSTRLSGSVFALHKYAPLKICSPESKKLYKWISSYSQESCDISSKTKKKQALKFHFQIMMSFFLLTFQSAEKVNVKTSVVFNKVSHQGIKCKELKNNLDVSPVSWDVGFGKPLLPRT